MAIAEVAGRRATGRGVGAVFATPFPGNVTSGNLLVVAGTIGSENSFTGGGSPAGVTITVTDTRGTVYSVVRGSVIGVNVFQRQTFIAYGLAPSSGANTVTITLSNPCSIGYAIDEFSGNHASSPFHNSSAVTASGATPRTGTIFPSVSNVMLVGVMAHSAPTTPLTPNAGVTEIGEWETNGGSADNNNSAFNAAFRVFSGTGSFFLSWTTAFIPWGSLVVAFRPPTPVTPERTTVGKSASLLWKVQKTVGRSAQLLWSVEVVEWPDIPVPLRAHRRAIDLQNLTTEMETGRLRKRRQQEDRREIWDVTWNFTEDQFETFKEFFDTTLKNGSIRFHIELLGVDRTVEFFTPYSFNHTDNLFSVSASLLVQPALPVFTSNGLKVWLKADALSLTEGAAVSSWTDSSGENNHATQATGSKQPSYHLGVLNDLPTVRFDGTADVLELPNFASGFTEGEFFVVMKGVSDTGPDFGSTPWRFGMSGNRDHWAYQDGNVYSDWGSTTRYNLGNPSPLFNQWRLVNIVSKAGEWTCRIDGDVFYTRASNTVGFPTPIIGGWVAEFWPGDFAEMMVYNRVLTATERKNVENHLRAKYDLY